MQVWQGGAPGSPRVPLSLIVGFDPHHRSWGPTHRLHFDFRWRHLRHALEIRFIGLVDDAPPSAGSDGYCPTSGEKAEPGTILSSGSGEGKFSSSGKQETWGRYWGYSRDSRQSELPRVQSSLAVPPLLISWSISNPVAVHSAKKPGLAGVVAEFSSQLNIFFSSTHMYSYRRQMHRLEAGCSVRGKIAKMSWG